MGDDHPPTVFDPSDPNIKNDLNMMVYQYLREQQLFNTADSIQNELGLKVSETAAKRYPPTSYFGLLMLMCLLLDLVNIAILKYLCIYVLKSVNLHN